MRLELLLLDWFFNEEEEAVCTSFLSGPVEVLVVIMRTIIYEITHKCGLHVIFNEMMLPADGDGCDGGDGDGDLE